MSPTTHFREIRAESPPVAALAVPESRGLRREREAWTDTLEQENGDGKIFGEASVTDSWASAVSRWVVDACLTSDVNNLHAGLETLRCAHVRLRPHPEVARLEATLTVLAETTRAGLDRARQAWIIETLDPATWAAQMLTAMDKNPGITSAELAKELSAAAAQISRSGTALIERGLAVKTRHGRERRWRLTPRGSVAVEALRHRSVGSPGEGKSQL